MARACCLPSQQIIIYVTPPAPHLFIIGTKELWQTHLCLCCCIIVSGLGSVSTPFVSWLLEQSQIFTLTHTDRSQIAHWASIAYCHAALMISHISLFVCQFARFMYVCMYGFFFLLPHRQWHFISTEEFMEFLSKPWPHPSTAHFCCSNDVARITNRKCHFKSLCFTDRNP